VAQATSWFGADCIIQQEASLSAYLLKIIASAHPWICWDGEKRKKTTSRKKKGQKNAACVFH